MCKVSEETILKANERMRKYKIGQNNKNVSPMGFTVDTHVQGKTYSQTFTENSINAIFERVLSKAVWQSTITSFMRNWQGMRVTW